MNLSPSEMFAAVGLLINAGAVVWGAATLSAAVKNLTEVVAEMKRIQEQTSTYVQGLLARMAVVEDRLDIKKLRN
jgi:hypothetical protein